MPNDKKFGDLSLAETATIGLLDFARNLRPLLLIAAFPAVATGLWRIALLGDGVEELTLGTLALVALPEYLLFVPFYMAMLYLLSRLHRDPPHTPATTDAMLAGVALFLPFLFTTLMLAGILLGAALLLGPLVQVDGGQIIMGPGALLGAALLYLLVLAFSFYPHIILFDQRSGFPALSGSFQLFRRYWWRILGVLLFPVALIAVVQTLWLQLTLATLTENEQPGLLLATANQFFSWFIIGLFEAVRLVLFQDLRAREAQPS